MLVWLPQSHRSPPHRLSAPKHQTKNHSRRPLSKDGIAGNLLSSMRAFYSPDLPFDYLVYPQYGTDQAMVAYAKPI